MVAIFLPECGGGGCSRVEHQRIGTSSLTAVSQYGFFGGLERARVGGSRWRHAIGL